MVKNERQNKLTKREQSTTTAYKMMSDKINNLEKSLKKTQDESEKERKEKHELEKKKILLEAELSKNNIIEVIKFLSSVGMGFSINYLTSGQASLGLSIGIPSLIIFIVCLIKDK